MARRHEFRPDKTGNGFFNKLYLTAQQRRKILKWVLYAAVLLAASLLQDVVLHQFRIFDATTDLVPCIIILICVLEGAQTGCIFTLAAAAIYQFSVSDPGPYAIALITILAVLASILRKAYLQMSFRSTLLCAGAAILVYEMAIFAMGVFLGNTVFSRIGVFFLTACYSTAAIPLLYPLCRLIETIGGESWKE